MNKIQNILAYLCMHYPHKGELSKARLTKLVYLADWFSSLADSKQLTGIKWLFNHYGPYVDDITTNVAFHGSFKMTAEQTVYGTPKYLIQYFGDGSDISLSKRERQILDLVIDKTKSLYFNDFIDYVYSTYPVQSNNRYSYLDLVKLADEYRNETTALSA